MTEATNDLILEHLKRQPVEGQKPMTRFAMIAATVATTAMLAGCGGGDGGGEMPTKSEAQPPGPPETRTGGQLLQDGVTLSAHHTAAVREELGKVTSMTWDEFVLRRADGSAAVMDVNGLTYELALADDDGFVASNRSVYYEGRADNGDWFADSKLYFVHPEREEHMVVVRLTSNAPTWRGYAVLGNRSHQIDDMRTGTATYDGDVSAAVDIYQGDASGIWSRYYDSLYSDNGRLVADFDAGTVSGQFTDWFLETDSGEESIDITATLEAASITADGFAGAFILTGADLDGEANASYEGSFYGPGAENAAGVISGTYTASGETPGAMVGFFTAEQ